MEWLQIVTLVKLLAFLTDFLFFLSFFSSDYRQTAVGLKTKLSTVDKLNELQ